MTSPRAAQVKATTAVVEWYLRTHFGSRSDSGLLNMFCDPERVGAFAIDPAALRAGDGAALFRLLVTTAMFQRRQDVQILRILRGISPPDAEEIGAAPRLLALVDETPCRHLRTTAALHDMCDLSKDPITRSGCCTKAPAVACHLKRHTVLLKRYGHFGKVPTSLALVVREAGVDDLSALRQSILDKVRGRRARAQALEEALSRAWRVNQKIASMFLSAVTNPDLGAGVAPWTDGVDWTYFVVIDSNVDLFLASINYEGGRSYDARREFVRAVARRIDLKALDRRLHRFNPRLVQQAMYLFMSQANRRAAEGDCMHLGARACATCPKALRRRCPVGRPTSAAEERTRPARANG